MTGRSITTVGAAVAALVLGVGAVSAAAGVDITGFAFSPAEVTVEVGETVTWTNSDPVAHTVTADGGAFDSGALDSGGIFEWTPAVAGTFAYHCDIHPSMTASVAVVEAPTPPPSEDVTITAPPTDAVVAGDTPAPADRGWPAVVLVLAGLAVILVGRGRGQWPWRVRGSGGRPRFPSTR